MIKLFIIFFLFIINNSYSEKYYLSYDINPFLKSIIDVNFQFKNKIFKYQYLDTSQIDYLNDSKAEYMYDKSIIVKDPTLQKQVLWNKYYFLNYNENREVIFINISDLNFVQLTLGYFENLNLKKIIINKYNIDYFEQIMVDDKLYIILPYNYKFHFIFTANIFNSNLIKLDKPIKYKILDIEIAKELYIDDNYYHLQKSFDLNFCKNSSSDNDYGKINYFYSKKNKKCIFIIFNESFDTKFNYDINQLIEINNILDLDDELIHPFFSNVKIYKSK
jgi:hypothetical protein